MCGGIVGTLALESRGNAISRQLAFNGGRIASYALAGAVAGALGSLAHTAGPWLALQLALFALANAVMMLLGLYVAGWGRGVLKLEAAGAHVWRAVEPFARRLLPIDSTPRAFGAGLAWGWVPCGLVYSILVLAAASASALSGALVMVAFGFGTLPTLLASGFAAQALWRLRRIAWVRRGAGLAIIALGVVGLARIPGLGDALLAGWLCIA
jgi:sulfite exporter TauE/SafE